LRISKTSQKIQNPIKARILENKKIQSAQNLEKGCLTRNPQFIEFSSKNTKILDRYEIIKSDDNLD
jgi:hypothetical protein